MKHTSRVSVGFALVAVGTVVSGWLGATTVSSAVAAEPTAPAPDGVYGGRARVYRSLDAESLEKVSTADRIKAVTAGNSAATEVWRALENGEKLECLECIPRVEQLLYADDARVREISAWWLRRRVFGVFGPGETYSRVIGTLADGKQSVTKRARAAEALGEFMARGGIGPLSTALGSDTAPEVRAAAARALARLNSLGEAGVLAAAIADSDATVRAAALHAAGRINGFTDAAAIAAQLGDKDVAVRRAAVRALATLRPRSAVAALSALLDTGKEPDALVRKLAVSALGAIGDSAARAAVENAATNDPDPFVRDVARMAVRRL